MPYLLGFIIGLFLLAVLLRINFFFYILYIFFGIYFFSRLWAEKGAQNVEFRREFSERGFPGEKSTAKLHIKNQSLLPLPWLRLHESLPLQLRSPNFYQTVMSLWPKEERTITYDLEYRRRGYYPLGPLVVRGGDLFGIAEKRLTWTGSDAIIVYPRIVALARFGLPAQTPFGSVPTKNPFMQDPTRLMGVREYSAGDSMRHIHWTASAARGTLMTKRFEPAISIEAQIYLNLNRAEYSLNRAEPASELAITTAASIAQYLSDKRQAVGLSTNGHDPLLEADAQIAIPARKGRGQLMQILESLAKVEMSTDTPFEELLRRARLELTWGGSAIIITSDATDTLFDQMITMRRSGFYVMLIVVDAQGAFGVIKERASQIGVVAHEVWQERDLDVWR